MVEGSYEGSLSVLEKPMSSIIGKRVKLKLSAANSRGGNAFFLMAAFQARAMIEGWDEEEIRQVIEPCLRGNYDNLRNILARHCDQDHPESLESIIYNPIDDTQIGHP